MLVTALSCLQLFLPAGGQHKEPVRNVRHTNGGEDGITDPRADRHIQGFPG